MLLTGIKDVDMIILNKLEDVDLVKMCQMNKQADEICKNQNFWLNRIRIKFPYLGLNVLNKYRNNRSWSEYYIEDLRQITPDNAQKYLWSRSEIGRLDHIIIAMNKGSKGRNIINTEAVVWASKGGYLDVVKYLVEHGADINIYTYNDDMEIVTAVEEAYRVGNIDIVDYLVSQGATDPRQ